MFLTLEQISNYLLALANVTVDISTLSELQKANLIIGANILYILVVGFVFYILWKIISRLVNSIF